MAGRRRTPAGSDAARSAGEAATLRVLTLNAHQGVGGRHRRGLLAGIRSALRAAAADLVFLQEVGGDIGAEDDQEHCEMLADEVWPQFAYGLFNPQGFAFLIPGLRHSSINCAVFQSLKTG